jgi:hypothetical protein
VRSGSPRRGSANSKIWSSSPVARASISCAYRR